MIILALSIVLAVSLVIYLFNKLIAKNLSLVTRTIHSFGSGQLETRISKRRSDEFGDLFTVFNNMADTLESQLNAQGEVADEEGKSELDVSAITRGMVDDKTIVRMNDADQDS
jgi:methyl-accepting chemotaxis protein